MNLKRKRKLITILAVLAIVTTVVVVRGIGLKEQESLKQKRQAEIIAFWQDYESVKSQDSDLAKHIKGSFVEEMSKEMSVEELLELVNKTLENPISLEELINE